MYYSYYYHSIILLFLLLFFCFSLLSVSGTLSLAALNRYTEFRNGDSEHKSENHEREETVGDTSFFFLASKEANARVHGEGWCFFSFSTNVRVRETSGTEGEAKKEIYKRYIYTYNTNKYIFLYPLFLERNRRFDNQEKLSRVSSIELISMSYIYLSLSPRHDPHDLSLLERNDP